MGAEAGVGLLPACGKACLPPPRKSHGMAKGWERSQPCDWPQQVQSQIHMQLPDP